MPGPKSYTDLGGGGPNPPHGEDFFNRIVNVHWPEEAPKPSGGVFIAGDFNGNIHYLRVGVGVTGAPKWQNLGQHAFAESERILGSAYGLVGGKEPAFVLVGGGGSTTARGVIMASQDGLNWSQVFTFGAMSDTFTGATIFGVTWDGSSFWAGGHQSDSFADFDTEIRWMTEVDVLFNSPDGFSWSEAGRYVMRVDSAGGAPFPPWPEYTTGLLESHCSDVVRDNSNNNGVPGGVFGYDQASETLIAPTDPPAIDYFTGGVGVGAGGAVNVIKTKVGAGGSFPSNPGLPVLGVATAGGSWVAAGGDTSTSEGVGQAAIMIPSSVDEHGFTWKRLDPDGKAIDTICGGQAKTPPP